MGNKITIDSATMTNKLFELLEAKWHFDTSNIDAFIEKKSIIHALVEFTDGSTTAHFAGVDMKLPIAFALNSRVEEEILPPVNLLEIGALEFLPITSTRYPIWEIKDEVLANPQRGVVLNRANEIAIEKFFKGELNIVELAELTKKVFKKFESVYPKSLNEIFEIDKEVKQYIKEDL